LIRAAKVYPEEPRSTLGVKTISLTQSSEVQKKRKKINVYVDGLSMRIHNQLMKMQKLKKKKKVIEKNTT